jgi:hypothetical protein
LKVNRPNLPSIAYIRAGDLHVALVQLLASAVALMMAMGIGRFALTPQLPQLIAEGQFDLTAPGWSRPPTTWAISSARWTPCSPAAGQVRLRLHGGCGCACC